MGNFFSGIIVRMIGVGIIALVLGGFVWHYKNLQAEAAKVPGLEAQLVDVGQRATALAKRNAAIIRARSETEKDLSEKLKTKDLMIVEIKRISKNVEAATNPVCFPSPDDRRVRNDAVRGLFGAEQVGAPTAMPASSSPTQ
jgi:hypothetical protein